MERRGWVKWLSINARIAVETVGRPVERYAIRLEIWDGAGWRTVHLFDNAHGNHDSHRYRGDEKLPAESTTARSVVEAIPVALRLLSDEWERIIENWRHDQ